MFKAMNKEQSVLKMKKIIQNFTDLVINFYINNVFKIVKINL